MEPGLCLKLHNRNRQTYIQRKVNFDFYDFIILWCICSIMFTQILFKFCLHGNACSSKAVSAEQTECQAFSPVVRIGTTPPPHPQASVSYPPSVRGGGIHTRWGERGWGIPIPTKGPTLYFRFLCTLWRYPLRMGNLGMPKQKIVASFLM